MKPIEFSDDAWGRRLSRDWPNLSPSMRMTFYVAFTVEALSVWLSLPALLSACAMLVVAVLDSWLMGGPHLIGRSALTAAALWLLAAAAIRWVLPSALNFSAYGWYHRTRR